jgi:CHAT domain-containing protein
VTRQPSLRTLSGLFLAEQLQEVVGGVAAAAQFKSQEAFAAALRLPADTVGYYFLFGDESLLTWVIRGTEVEFVERPITARQIERLAVRLEVEVARASTEDTWRKTLSDLYDLVLRDLPGADSAANVLVVPDGPLHRVPFGALRDSARDQFVFERAAVRMAPNLALALRPAPAAGAEAIAPTRVLAIGEPTLRETSATEFEPLTGAREEARAVAALYPSAALLIGDSATKRDVLDKLAGANVVHFAGHAIAGSSSTEARLLLAGSAADPSTGLAARDLAGRVTRARVVLAACQTAASSGERASGISSVAATFLRAGAASVVGTLWRVNDVASEQFFLNVHRQLANGQRTSVAVARAQRACYASDACRAAPATWIGTSAYGVE